MSQNSSNAKHAFFYLIAFFALGFVATAIGQVIFQLINFALVESTPSYSGEFQNGILRFAISSLIIAAPIYYFATRKINSELAQNLLDPDSAIRKWMTYLAIFIAAAVAIGDLIFVLNSFLAGELTSKFLFKAFTIFVIAGGFGGYYFTDLHRSNFARDTKIKIFGFVFIAVVLACLVVSFSLIDSPKKARELREDSERVNELREIAWAVADYSNRESELPRNLEALVDEKRIREDTLLDPVSDEKYEFEIIDSQNYELCANFTHSNSDEKYLDPEWEHAAGRACFAIEISENANYPTVDVRPIVIPRD